MRTPLFTCIGDVRGHCSVTHHFLRTAAQCCARDQRNCEHVGGYSDRHPRKIVDGAFERLGEDESATVDAYINGDVG